MGGGVPVALLAGVDPLGTVPPPVDVGAVDGIGIGVVGACGTSEVAV